MPRRTVSAVATRATGAAMFRLPESGSSQQAMSQEEKMMTHDKEVAIRLRLSGWLYGILEDRKKTLLIITDYRFQEGVFINMTVAIYAHSACFGGMFCPNYGARQLQHNGRLSTFYLQNSLYQ